MKSRHINRTYFMIAFIVIIIVILLAVILKHKLSSDIISAERITVGSLAPDFDATTTSGEEISLNEVKGNVVVLSFISCVKPNNAAYTDDSLSEITFLKSIDNQYRSQGVVILVMDSSYILTGKNTRREDVINFKYDHLLDDIPVLTDNRTKKMALKYGVTELPTTFIISQDGFISQRLEGLSSTAQLAGAIEALIGSVSYRPNDDTRHGASDSEKVTPAEAVFHGFDLARRLSDNIWLVDGGQDWDSNVEYPIRWLVINADDDSILNISVKNVETGDNWSAEGIKLERLPDDETENILSNLSKSKTDKLYTAIMTMEVTSSGYYELKVEVINDGNKSLVYDGFARVYAQ